MVITDEQTVLALPGGGTVQKHDPDGPPPYSPLSVLDIPSDVRPSNFLSVSRTLDVVRDRYLIDLALRIPRALLPASERSDAANLQIRNVTGTIDASIWLVNSEHDAQRKRAVVEVSNTVGPVRLALHAEHTLTPFTLNVHTYIGPIALCIPRSFRGPLTIRNGRAPVELSPTLASNFQTLKDVNGVRTGVVGDWRAEEGSADVQDAGHWSRSTIEVGTTLGPIRISYVDEQIETPSDAQVNQAQQSSESSFLGRLLGRRRLGDA